MKRKSKQPTDPAHLCMNCGRFVRLPTFKYCQVCYEYMRYRVRVWARQQNPIPGEDVPEC